MTAHTGGDPDYCPACRADPPHFPQCPGHQEDTVTPADELRAAAQTLLDSADETEHEIDTNDYWHSKTSDRPVWWANGVRNAIGGPAGDHAALFPPATARTIAKWLRSLTGLDVSEHAALPEEYEHALAVARAINATR